MERHGRLKSLAEEERFLREKLDQLPKSELVDLILQLGEISEHVQNQLFLKFAQGEDEISVCRRIMQQCIDATYRRGIISNEDVDIAAKGGEQVLQKAEERACGGDIGGAVALCATVLSSYIPMIAKTEDQGTVFGFLIDRCISRIHDYIEQISATEISVDEKRRIYHLIRREAMKNWYGDWVDWRADLLGACVSLCDDPEIRRSLYETVDMIIEEAPDNLWSKVYVAKRLKEIIYSVMKTYDTSEDIDTFLENNLEYKSFRRDLLKSALEEKDYPRVIDICGRLRNMEGEHISREWRRYLYTAYKETGDSVNQRRLAEELVLEGDISYYADLKQLYPAEEWEDEMRLLLAILDDETPGAVIYAEILLIEGYEDEVVNYIQETGRYKMITAELAERYPKQVLWICDSYLYSLVGKALEEGPKQLESVAAHCRQIGGEAFLEAIIGRWIKEDKLDGEQQKIVKLIQ